MFELERDQIRKTYQLCRIGFFLLTVSLVPACILFVAGNDRLAGRPATLQSDSRFALEPVGVYLSVWGSLAGAMLLWGRWDQKSWQHGLACCWSCAWSSMVVWFMDRGENQPPGHPDWFRLNLGQALGWAEEFALLAGLSGDYLVHLGLSQADDSARSTRSLAATGAVIWLLRLYELTNSNGRGWPLRQRRGETSTAGCSFSVPN